MSTGDSEKTKALNSDDEGAATDGEPTAEELEALDDQDTAKHKHAAEDEENAKLKEIEHEQQEQQQQPEEEEVSPRKTPSHDPSSYDSVSKNQFWGINRRNIAAAVAVLFACVIFQSQLVPFQSQASLVVFTDMQMLRLHGEVVYRIVEQRNPQTLIQLITQRRNTLVEIDMHGRQVVSMLHSNTVDLDSAKSIYLLEHAQDHNIRRTPWLNPLYQKVRTLMRKEPDVFVEVLLAASCPQMASYFIQKKISPTYDCVQNRSLHFQEFASDWLSSSFQELTDDLFVVDLLGNPNLSASLGSTATRLVVLSSRKVDLTTPEKSGPYVVVAAPTASTMINFDGPEATQQTMNSLMRTPGGAIYQGSYKPSTYATVTVVVDAPTKFHETPFFDDPAIRQVLTDMARNPQVEKMYIVLTRCSCTTLTDALTLRDISADSHLCTTNRAYRTRLFANYAYELREAYGLDKSAVDTEYVRLDGNVVDLHAVPSLAVRAQVPKDSEYSPLITHEERKEATTAIAQVVKTSVLSPSSTNIVFFGEHGVGKTSSLQSVCYYSGCPLNLTAALVTNAGGSASETLDYWPLKITDSWTIYDTKGMHNANFDEMVETIKDILKGFQKPLCEMFWDEKSREQRKTSWFGGSTTDDKDSQARDCTRPDSANKEHQGHAIAFFSTYMGKPTKDFAAKLKRTAGQFGVGVVYVLGDLTGCTEKTATGCKRKFAEEIGVSESSEVVMLQATELTGEVLQEDMDFATTKANGLYLQPHHILELLEKVKAKVEVYKTKMAALN